MNVKRIAAGTIAGVMLASTLCGCSEVRRMKVDCGAYIRSQAIENLLCAQKRAADEGKAGDVVVLTRLLLKVSKRFDKKLLELGLEKDGA